MPENSRDALTDFDDAPLDPILERAFGEYLDLANRGAAPPAEEFLARYPTVSRELAMCLRGIGVDVPSERRQAPVGAPNRIGPYRLRAVIGRGAMGVVYQAVREGEDGKNYAIKVMSFGVRGDDRILRRFQREAEALRSLHHPNIIPILDTGIDGEIVYYVMPFVEGRPLDLVLSNMRGDKGGIEEDVTKEETWYGPSDSSTATRPLGLRPSRLARTPPVGEAGDRATAELFPDLPGVRLPLDSPAGTPQGMIGLGAEHYRDIASLLVPVCRALTHAHAQNVIHRDIKPANFILTPDRRLLLTDFGLAKKIDAPSVTRSGDLVGTPMYMSPEQAMAKRVPVDHRTDIYSLGATAYECLSLRSPFSGPSTADVLRHVISKDPVRLSRICPNMPYQLEAVIHRAMEKDPDNRYSTADEMARDLENYLEGRPVRASYPAWPIRVTRRIQRQSTHLALAVILGLLVLAAVFLIFGSGPRRPNRELSEQRAREEIRDFFQQGRYDRVVQKVDEVWTDPSDRPIDVNAILGRSRWHQHQYDEALEVLESCGEALIRHPIALQIRANLWTMLDGWQPALRDLALLEDHTTPRSVTGDLAQAYALIHVGRLDEAWAIANSIADREAEQAIRLQLRLTILSRTLRGQESVAEDDAVSRFLEYFQKISPRIVTLEAPLFEAHERHDFEQAGHHLRTRLRYPDVQRTLEAHMFLVTWALRESPPNAESWAEELDDPRSAFYALAPRYLTYVVRAQVQRFRKDAVYERIQNWLQSAEPSEQLDVLGQSIDGRLSTAPRLKALVAADAADLTSAIEHVRRARRRDPENPSNFLAEAWIALGLDAGERVLEEFRNDLDARGGGLASDQRIRFWKIALELFLALENPEAIQSSLDSLRGVLDEREPGMDQGTWVGLRACERIWRSLLTEDETFWVPGREGMAWNEAVETVLLLEPDERMAALRCSARIAEFLGRLDVAQSLTQEALRTCTTWQDWLSNVRLLYWRSRPIRMETLAELRRDRPPGYSGITWLDTLRWLILADQAASFSAAERNEWIGEIQEALDESTEGGLALPSSAAAGLLLALARFQSQQDDPEAARETLDVLLDPPSPRGALVPQPIRARAQHLRESQVR